jgi:hypothetical protein
MARHVPGRCFAVERTYARCLSEHFEPVEECPPSLSGASRDVLPAQEKDNVAIVLQSGAGELAPVPSAALEVLYHRLADGGALLAQRASNTARGV